MSALEAAPDEHWRASWIAAAGPLAEAIWRQQSDAEADPYMIFDDHLAGAVIADGEGDLRRSYGLLDDQTSVEFMREAPLSLLVQDHSSG